MSLTNSMQPRLVGHAFSKLGKSLVKRLAARIPTSVYNRMRAYAIISQKFPEVVSLACLADPRDVRRLLLHKVGSNCPILLLEFGSFSGGTMRQFASSNDHPESRFFGFDLFVGLPEDWVAGYGKGAFDVKGVPPKIDDPRVSFMKGWFSDTLPGFLKTQPLLTDDRFTKVVHYDADLYSSTLFVMSQLWPVLNSYYCLFDEFVGDEARALGDFCSAFPVDVELFAKARSEQSNLCVAGSIGRRDLT